MEAIATRNSERNCATGRRLPGQDISARTLPDSDFSAKRIHDFTLKFGAMANPRGNCLWTVLNGNERIEWFHARVDYARIRPSRATSFLQGAQRLDRMGSTDAALDLLYDNFDAMMRDGRFCELDALLRAERANDYRLDLLLGILTATLPGKSKLPSRGKFLKDAENVLRERGEYEEGLLTGLEGFDDGPNPRCGSGIATEC